MLKSIKKTFYPSLKKETFKKYVPQDSQVLNPLPPCSPLFVFEHPKTSPTPSLPKVLSFWLELILSPSISILVKFRENKLSTSIFG